MLHYTYAPVGVNLRKPNNKMNAFTLWTAYVATQVSICSEGRGCIPMPGTAPHIPWHSLTISFVPTAQQLSEGYSPAYEIEISACAAEAAADKTWQPGATAAQLHYAR